jgi:hypothetical protein
MSISGGPQMSNPPVKIGFCHALRDIIVTAINKGQLLVTMLGLIIIIFVWRLPGDSLGRLAEKILEGLVNLHLVGWFLFVVVSGSWAIVGKLGRDAVQNEMKRVAEEKALAQSRALRESVKSSKI